MLLQTERVQLVGGGGALEVGGNEQGAQAVHVEVEREPRGERGLAGALCAADKHLRRAALGAQQRLLPAAEDGDF